MRKIRKLGQLPGCPLGERILVRPDHISEESEAGLIIPDIAKHHSHFGTVVHAGLGARDVMWDNGWKLGDRVWFGQYAGIWEEWDRITKEGASACPHESWERAPTPKDVTKANAYKCTTCGAARLVEPLLVMNVGDVQCSDELEDRIADGTARIVRGVTPEGKTRHFIQREGTNGAC